MQQAGMPSLFNEYVALFPRLAGTHLPLLLLLHVNAHVALLRILILVKMLRRCRFVRCSVFCIFANHHVSFLALISSFTASIPDPKQNIIRVLASVLSKSIECPIL